MSPGAITMNTTDMNHVQVACNNTGLYAKEGYSLGNYLNHCVPYRNIVTSGVQISCMVLVS